MVFVEKGARVDVKSGNGEYPIDSLKERGKDFNKRGMMKDELKDQYDQLYQFLELKMEEITAEKQVKLNEQKAQLDTKSKELLFKKIRDCMYMPGDYGFQRAIDKLMNSIHSPDVREYLLGRIDSLFKTLQQKTEVVGARTDEMLDYLDYHGGNLMTNLRDYITSNSDSGMMSMEYHALFDTESKEQSEDVLQKKIDYILNEIEEFAIFAPAFACQNSWETHIKNRLFLWGEMLMPLVIKEEYCVLSNKLNQLEKCKQFYHSIQLSLQNYEED